MSGKTTASKGRKSSVNSTTIALAAGATFLGEWEDILNFPSISILGSTDQNATLYAQFSTDASTVTRDIQLSTGTDTNLGLHDLITVARYFRVKVVNGATPMGSLDISTIYFEEARIALPTGRPADGIDEYGDVLSTQSLVLAQDPSGIYSPLQMNTDGELLTNTHSVMRETRALYNDTTISSDTYAILIDLSAEPYTNYASIDNIEISCRLTSNNSTANVKIGVITRIDGTDADISYLISVPFSAHNADTFLAYINDYQPASLKFEVDSGSLVGAYTNDASAGVVAVNTGITLDSPRGSVTPDVGDVIIFFDHTGTNYNPVVSAIYHTH